MQKQTYEDVGLSSRLHLPHRTLIQAVESLGAGLVIPHPTETTTHANTLHRILERYELRLLMPELLVTLLKVPHWEANTQAWSGLSKLRGLGAPCHGDLSTTFDNVVSSYELSRKRAAFFFATQFALKGKSA